MRTYAHLENARILDVGCGLGLYVQRFRALSDDVHGVDIDPDKVRQAGELLPNIRQASAEHLPYPDNTFDVVLSHEVLEHVDDDLAAAREAYRVLKPGTLIVFVPNRFYPRRTGSLARQLSLWQYPPGELFAGRAAQSPLPACAGLHGP